MLQRTIRPKFPIDLQLTLAPLRRGRADPTIRLERDAVWRAARTPEGPASVRLAADGKRITVAAWGPGAAWALDASPELVGLHDAGGFEPHHAVLQELHRRHRGLRMCRSNGVIDVVVAKVLEQKVTRVEARRAYVRLVRAFGEPAPGPGNLMLPPRPDDLAALPYWAFHPAGIERRRAETIKRACARSRWLEQGLAMPRERAYARLSSIAGIGPWTTAEVARIAFGDPDAVRLGDYHLPHLVSWALTGEPRGDDERMLELLEPYRGQRARAVRLIEIGGDHPPRRAPRVRLRSIRTM